MSFGVQFLDSWADCADSCCTDSFFPLEWWGHAKKNEEQHTATHCNTLQHTATHCNTLQHTVTHCNALQHTIFSWKVGPRTEKWRTMHSSRVYDSKRFMSHIWMSHVTHMNELCHIYEWVMSHIRIGHITYINEKTWGTIYSSRVYESQNSGLQCGPVCCSVLQCGQNYIFAWNRETKRTH